jgi:alcohol dehydrogenase
MWASLAVVYGGLPSHCLDEEGASGIGWIFGHLIDGTQAEYVRVSFAENSLHKMPGGVSDEAAVTAVLSPRPSGSAGTARAPFPS